MRRFIEIPNIPVHRVTHAIISGNDQKIVEYVRSFDIDLLLTNANRQIDKFISNHADINYHHLGGRQIVADSSQSVLIAELEALGMDVRLCETEISGVYPGDCRLNFARIGNMIAGKACICEPGIIDYCKRNQIRTVNVNQGYCKCSVCIVNEKAVITDDESIKIAIDKNGIDCLLIQKGDVFLSGYDYGFIGGACALIDKNKLMFFGNLKAHRNYKDIMQFLTHNNCSAVFSADFPLTDIGGMIPIMEEA